MDNNKKIISTSEWIITKLIMFIPIVNIIMLIIWAFNNNTNINKANWAKANLIIMVFIFGLIHGFGLSTKLQEIASEHNIVLSLPLRVAMHFAQNVCPQINIFGVFR